MILYRCTGNGGGTPVSTDYEIELVENNTTSGESTFTITESGTYLIIVSNSYNGSRSITLPSGRTATIDEDIETTYGMTVVVADLQANDVVTMSAIDGGWLALSKQIYKLTNISVSAVDDTEARNDGSQTFSVSSSGNYLVIGLCFGKSNERRQYYDDTEHSTNIKQLCSQVGVYTCVRIIAGSGSNIPELDMYGYDGGGVFFISLSIS